MIGVYMRLGNVMIWLSLAIISIITYSVIHLDLSAITEEVYEEQVTYQNNINKQPINNII